MKTRTSENKPALGSPIKSGWRGHVNGFVEATNTQVEASEIILRLDKATAWALCNLLTTNAIACSNALESNQKDAMENLGAAIGRMLDHPSANNGGRVIVKP